MNSKLYPYLGWNFKSKLDIYRIYKQYKDAESSPKIEYRTIIGNRKTLPKTRTVKTGKV
ncbi:hypothetical protein PL11201_510035 [Planktothrix sp. PCC 11201]|nr:hypothetical protein PL11201_510035 [Planktothrix sp. PCC 11201]